LITSGGAISTISTFYPTTTGKATCRGAGILAGARCNGGAVRPYMIEELSGIRALRIQAKFRGVNENASRKLIRYFLSTMMPASLNLKRRTHVISSPTTTFTSLWRGILGLTS